VKRYYAQFRQLESYDHTSEWKTHATFTNKEAAIEFIAKNTKQGRTQGRVLYGSQVIWTD
jgi:hypothetical protein